MATPFNAQAFFANLNSILAVAEQSFVALPAGASWLQILEAAIPVVATAIVVIAPKTVSPPAAK